MAGRLRSHIFLFLALTVVYQANLRPIDASDSFGASLIPFAVILDHGVTLDRFVPWMRDHVWFTPSIIHQAHGHYFSWYPIGGGLLVTPLYVPVAFVVRGRDPASLIVIARILGKVAACTIAALSAVVMLMLLRRITSAGWAWALTLVYALGTETWSVSSQALWQHGPAELGIAAAFLSLDVWSEHRESKGALWICGASTAVAFICRPTALGLLPAIVVALWFAKPSFKQVARVLALPLAGGVLLAAYNLYVFGRLSGGYAASLLRGSMASGLAGIFLSPGRGLLVYTPVVVFAFAAFSGRAAAVRRKHEPLWTAAVAFLIFDSIAIASAVIWWGGFTWGPRMLTELAPALIVLMAMGVPAIDRPWPRRAFAALAIYSVLIQAVGAFCYPNGHWDAKPATVDDRPSRLWDWLDNPIARTIRGGLYWEPYAIVGAGLSGGIPAAQRRIRELNISPYEEARPGGK